MQPANWLVEVLQRQLLVLQNYVAKVVAPSILRGFYRLPDRLNIWQPLDPVNLSFTSVLN